MARIWIFFNQKKALSYLILVALVIFGINAVFNIQRESAPEVQIPVAIVSSTLPGASPENIEKLIVNEIEKAVSGISNIDKVTSTSKEGVGVVVIKFNADADIKESIDDVKDAVDKIRDDLPEDATEPIVSDVNFTDQPVLIASIVSDLPVTEFKNEADNLTDEIEKIQGVSRAELSGIRDRQVTVIVNKKDLLAYKLTLQDVERAIKTNNVTMPIGSIEVDGNEYPINFKGDIEDTTEIANIPIKTNDGKIILLSDIAFVSDGVENYKTISRVSVNGELPVQAATLLVFKQKGADITKVSKEIAKLVEETNSKENANTKIVITHDAGETIIKDLNKLTRTGLTTIVLVFLVLLVALGKNEAIIASLSIPLSFLTAFIVMNATGNTINFISLFSLILAIGILVDTAIVVTEAIHTNIKSGLSKEDSVKKAIKEFHYPITTGNLTTIAVFFPLFTISGVTGEFIASIPFTVIAVLISSLIISLAFVPLIAASFLHKKNKSKFEDKQEMYTEKFKKWYEEKIPWILDSKKRKIKFVVGLSVLLLMLVVMPFLGFIKVSFFPQSDMDFLYINVENPQGTTLEKTSMSIIPIEEMLSDIPEIESFTTVAGAESAFDENPRSGHRFGSVTINLKSDKDKTSQKILEEIENKLSVYKNLNAKVKQPNDGPPSGAPVLITFFGDDIDELKEVANKSAKILEKIDGTRIVSSSAKDDASEFDLYINRAKAAKLGVSPFTIASTLRTAVFGTTATTIKKGSDEIDVIVKLNLNENWNNINDTNKISLDAIRELPINTPSGTIILGSLLTEKLNSSSERIQHEDEKRISTVSSQVKDGFVARDITNEFKEKIRKEIVLPEGITMKIGGETEDVNKSFKEMFIALIMGVILVLAVLVVQFNSFKQSLIILSVIPLSLIGVLLGLLLTQEYLSFPTMLGFIALAGIVVNNAIILVDVWNRLREENEEMPLRDVVIKGATLRLRPIFLTTVTTIIGIIPLIFASDVWRPIAIAIVFGLSFAVTLTLVLVPVLYLKFCKLTPNMKTKNEIIKHDKEKLNESFTSATKSLFIFAVLAFAFTPFCTHAFLYTPENIHYAYQEAPQAFSFDEYGQAVGSTVSGIPFRQRNILNDSNIRLQRFEIGIAYWYVSDKGIIWADTDLEALSIYISRIG